MKTETPTLRTDAATYPADFLGATLVTHRDCSRALERELVTLTAERDQLRAEVETEKNLHAQTRTVVDELTTICTDLKNAGGPPFIRSEAIRWLREDQAKLRAEVERLTFLHQCESDSSVAAFARAERAEAALAELHASFAGNVHAQRNELRAELAAERARLDWLQAQEVKRGLEITEGRDDPLPFLVLGKDGTTHWGNTYRDAIDAAMKEGAK
jgi:hypothetical protein